MPVRFENYTHSFNKKGKPVFAPSKLGRRIGNDLKTRIEGSVEFDEFYYHIKSGGHVAAIHSHRSNRYFARLDIENFFYRIGRNRVARCLHAIGVERPGHYAKWSTVKNPFRNPSYALPYGFVQSPIVATLVLMHSAAGVLLRELQERVTISVYVDDIFLSSNDSRLLQDAFDRTLSSLEESQFVVNPEKRRAPNSQMDIFNCDMVQFEARVTQARIDTFFAEEHTAAGTEAFARYCTSVEIGNA